MIRYIVFRFFSIVYSYSFSQDNRLIPVIDSVTVMNEKAFISWTFEDDPDYQLSGFKIYKAFGPSDTDFAPLIDVDSLTFSYTDFTSSPHQQSERYKIAAFSIILDSLSPSSDYHQSLFLSLHYDSCAQTMELDWNPYVNWEDNQATYDIYMKKGNEAFSFLTNTQSETGYLLNSYDANTSYSFFVRAKGSQGESSTSNIVDVFTNFPGNPEYLNFYSISVEETNQLHLQFEVDPQADILQYQLYRSDNKTSSYELLMNYTHDYETVSFEYVDQFITNKNVYYYHVQAENTCGDLVWSTDTLNNILLSVDTTREFVNTLYWPEFHPDLEEHYRIYRSSDRNTYTLLAEISTNTYADDFSVSAVNSDGAFCYYLEAHIPEMFTSPVNKSNIRCVYREAKVQAANIFTPNGDGKNDSFKPIVSFDTNEGYKFVIMNRWGELLFETSDPDQSWDGTFRNSKVPHGTYLYYLKFTDTQKKVVEKSGSITVYYP